MPELPDVAVFERRIAKGALDRRITDVDVSDAGMVTGLPASRLESTLEGQRFTDTHRHGKWCLVQVGDEDWLGLHFGMTGLPDLLAADDEPVPEHTRMLVTFDDGGRLAYRCQRRFGELTFVDEPDDLVSDRDLGPDALRLGDDGFADLLDARRGAVKSLMMNQSAMAGVGNIYADEVLFNARVHPGTAISDLDERERRRLRNQLPRVLEMAIDRQADPTRFPRTWLTPHRGEDDECPRCGAPLQHGTVAQRSTWWCPQDQPES